MKARLGIGLAALAVLAAAAMLLLQPDPIAEPSGRPLPRSMAAIGDSITQAVAVDRDALAGDASRSWATGLNPDDGIESHAERLTGAGALQGEIYNNSVPGATVADAVEQARAAVEQRVDYVVVLIGANDVCATGTGVPTTAGSFGRSFTRVMDTLTSGLPNASIYIVSIPNIYRLWEIGSEEPLTQQLWDGLGICRPVLSSALSEGERRVALETNEAFNTILERGCAAHANCRYDGGAIFDFRFEAEHVGPLDRFHPSTEGQAALAEVSWTQGFWPEI